MDRGTMFLPRSSLIKASCWEKCRYCSLCQEIVMYCVETGRVLLELPCSHTTLLLNKTLTDQRLDLHTLYSSDRLSVSKMLISPNTAASRFESLYILHAKICILYFSFIFNPRVSNLHHPNSINLVIIHYTGFKNCKCYIHLSSFTHFM